MGGWDTCTPHPSWAQRHCHSAEGPEPGPPLQPHTSSMDEGPALPRQLGRDEVPSMDGPSSSQCLHRGQTPAADPAPAPTCSQGCECPTQTVGLGQWTKLSTTARDKMRTGCRTGDNTAPVPGWGVPRAPAQAAQLEQCSRRAQCSAREGSQAPPAAAGGPRALCQDHAGAPGLCKAAPAGSATQQEY